METRIAGSIRGKLHFSEDSGNGVKSVNGSEIMNIAKQRTKVYPCALMWRLTKCSINVKGKLLKEDWKWLEGIVGILSVFILGTSHGLSHALVPS